MDTGPGADLGQPLEVTDNLKTFVNLVVSPTDRVEVYAFANYASKTTERRLLLPQPERPGGSVHTGAVTAWSAI